MNLRKQKQLLSKVFTIHFHVSKRSILKIEIYNQNSESMYTVIKVQMCAYCAIVIITIYYAIIIKNYYNCHSLKVIKIDCYTMLSVLL